MKKELYHVLGVMSGTSLDGMDLAEVSFFLKKDGTWAYTLGETETVPYPEGWKKRLQKAVAYSEARLLQLNEDYTRYLSEVINRFIKKHDISGLDAVCSHGHTILHQPEQGLTLQIGNLPKLAQELQQTVVCDFRVQDVALGGQGAPLVPVGDRLLFSEYDYCLNLGGFANVSCERDKERAAYDICPVNIVLNRYAEMEGQAYDAGGMLAASGTLDRELLDTLNALEYYKRSAPKSLGIEWVRQHIFPVLAASEATPRTILRTMTEHIAMQLAAQFSEKSTVLITGGGAYNQFLIERLLTHAALNVKIPENTLVEFKEAIIFGLMGVLRLREDINCLASVTGAAKDHSSGIIFK
ncbi:MAG: anhydro-N-acetylmuramic acid kinase [Altibacter sp.]|nr:anhydro-N-acetylmuramic acid kinase [Altibacter sp.]